MMKSHNQKELREPWIVGGFIAALALLAAVGMLLWHSITQQQISASMVNHTHQVVETVNYLIERLSDAENARRGFILSGQDRYLTHYKTATNRVSAAMADLERLYRHPDSPQQQEPDRPLAEMIAERLAIHVRSIELRQREGLDVGAQAKFMEEGQRVMEPIRQLAGTMQTEELHLLNERRKLLEKRVNWTKWFAVAGSVVSLGTLVFVFVLFTRENRKRIAAESVLVKANETLEQRVLERTLALQQSESRLRTILETALDAVITFNSEGMITGWNEQAVRTFGWPTDEVLGKQLQPTLFPTSNFENSHPEFSQFLKTGEGTVLNRRIEVFAIHKNGRGFPVELALTPADSDGTRTFTVFARDITERLAAEQASRNMNAILEDRVRERTAQLEAANHELEAFSYSVSHDLRAPLRHIDGFVQMLDEDTESSLSPSGKRWVRVISDAARQMGQLIDDLLEFSKMGRTPLHHHLTEMESLVHETIRSMEPETKGRTIEWQVGPLPAVSVDRAMIRQVWVNLLSNAVKYTRGREQASIQICHRMDSAGEHHFMVRDNGAGFDMKYADKLFSVFQRLHHAEEFEGTGIGLAHVRRIVNRHGGRTWAEGVPNQGASFHFTLPDTAIQESPLTISA